MRLAGRYDKATAGAGFLLLGSFPVKSVLRPVFVGCGGRLIDQCVYLWAYSFRAPCPLHLSLL